MQVSGQLYAPALNFKVLDAVNALKFDTTTREITVSRVVNQLLQQFDLLKLDHHRKKALKNRVIKAVKTLENTDQLKIKYKTKLPLRTSYIVIIPSYKQN